MLFDPDQFVLFSCEGTAERFIVKTLIERDELIIPKSRIVRNRIDGDWAVPRSRDIINEYLTIDYGDKPLLLIRIVDSHSDSYRPPKGYETKITVEYLRTHPEIEMLVIIAEGKYGEYTNGSKRLNHPTIAKQSSNTVRSKKMGLVGTVLGGTRKTGTCNSRILPTPPIRQKGKPGNP